MSAEARAPNPPLSGQGRSMSLNIQTSAEKSSSSKAAKAVSKTESSRKTAEKSAPSNGKGKSVRPAPGAVGFTNPVIAEAFRRAIKKYPSAFRRLTD